MLSAIYFSDHQVLSLALCFLLLLMGLYTFKVLERTRYAVVLLLLGAFGIRMFMAALDPFLNVWDEQFHVLVAKNMMTHPFEPMLYRYHVVPYDLGNWPMSHIWLHKQPLFQWQMALSMKLFGVNEIAARLPSALLSTFMVFCIYRIGKRTVNERVGFYAAFLFAVSWFGLELTMGQINTDHNDADFTAYIAASIWAWVEYVHSGKRSWTIWIGVFVGCALLVKWLPGILVFSGWGLWVLFDKEKRSKWISYRDMLLSAAIAGIIALPWQIYIFMRWPELARTEYEHNVRHFTEPLDGHAGTPLYHWEQLNQHYGAGQLVPWIVLLSVIFLYWGLKHKAYRIAFFTFVIIVYTFYTLTATKMPAFCYIVCPVIFIALAHVLDRVFELIKKGIRIPWAYNTVIIAALMYIGFLSMDLNRIQEGHTLISVNKSLYRVFRLNNAETFKKLDKILPSKDYVIFNCRPFEEQMGMFYSDYIIYGRILTDDEYKTLKAKGVKIAIFDGEHTTEMLRNDPEVFKIQSTMWNPDFYGIPQEQEKEE